MPQPQENSGIPPRGYDRLRAEAGYTGGYSSVKRYVRKKVFLITFSKAGQEDIVLTEDDLFDFQYEASCYSGETFELGGVNAKTLYLLIDNNTQRFSRGTFANCRVKLEIDGKFFGYYNTELPKRRNGVIELTAYDDMVKLDTEFPTDYTFPQTFWAVYAQCVFEAGLASEVSFDNVVLNGVWDNGIISADYTQYIYANSCRNLVAGMAEWNGGFAYINDVNKLQIDKFSKTVTREYSSGDLRKITNALIKGVFTALGITGSSLGIKCDGILRRNELRIQRHITGNSVGGKVPRLTGAGFIVVPAYKFTVLFLGRNRFGYHLSLESIYLRIRSIAAVGVECY